MLLLFELYVYSDLHGCILTKNLKIRMKHNGIFFTAVNFSKNSRADNQS